MKLIATSTALFALAAKAEDAPVVQAPDARRFHSIVSMAYSQVSTALAKNAFEEKIRKYGCHCFPADTKSAGGQGPAVDAMDSTCKRLYKCHKCIQLEYGMDAVDVNDGRYTWDLNGDDTISCDKNQNNPARKALCECDRAYAYQMKTVWDDAGFNGFYWKNNKWAKQNPTFDFDAMCQSTGAGGGKADMCCGSAFPNKEPYDSSNRDCCGETLFNILTQSCCTGNTIASIGSC